MTNTRHLIKWRIPTFIAVFLTSLLYYQAAFAACDGVVTVVGGSGIGSVGSDITVGVSATLPDTPAIQQELLGGSVTWAWTIDEIPSWSGGDMVSITTGNSTAVVTGDLYLPGEVTTIAHVEATIRNANNVVVWCGRGDAPITLSASGTTCDPADCYNLKIPKGTTVTVVVVASDGNCSTSKITGRVSDYFLKLANGKPHVKNCKSPCSCTTDFTVNAAGETKVFTLTNIDVSFMGDPCIVTVTVTIIYPAGGVGTLGHCQ
jgi:hypothetical protein